MNKRRMTTATHEIINAAGETVAWLRIGKNNQLAVDDPTENKIMYGSGAAFGYHVGYNIPKSRGADGAFPADAISGELHYFTGKNYGGYVVRPL